MRQPVSAAINGAAAGGGFAIALDSDIRIASTAAKFDAVFIKVGLSACDVGTSHFLPRLVDAGIAAELMLSGRIFKAEEARKIRLVSRVVEPEALEGSAVELARSIAENSEHGVWMTKKGLWSAVDAPACAMPWKWRTAPKSSAASPAQWRNPGRLQRRPQAP